MDINSLPDPLLQRILSCLPLGEILRLDHVCTKWAKVQRSICAQVTFLTILIGENQLPQLENHPFKILHQEDLPAVHRRLSQYHIDPKVNQLQFHWLDVNSAHLISRRLPAVKSLQISLHCYLALVYFGEKSLNRKSHAFESINHLLHTWSPQLVALKLYCSFSICRSAATEHIIPALFRAISQCSLLRHLTLEICNGFYYDHPKPAIDLPILATLEELYFHFVEFDEQMIQLLLRYAVESANLRSLNWMYFNRESFGESFFDDDRLTPLYDKFHQFTYTQLSPSCDDVITRHFKGLHRLTISVFEPAQIIEMLKRIRDYDQLFQLELYLHLAEWNNVPNLRPTEDDALVLNALRILYVFAPLHSHTDLYGVQWELVFPNLEVLHFANSFFRCDICQIEEPLDVENIAPAEEDAQVREDNENDNQAVAINDNVQRHQQERNRRWTECIRLTLQSWKACSKLRKVYTDMVSEVKCWDMAELWRLES